MPKKKPQKTKTWVAKDLLGNRVTFDLEGANMRFAYRYQFQDENGNTMKSFPVKTLTATIPMKKIPEKIKAAMTEIQDYLYDFALKDEGMD